MHRCERKAALVTGTSPDLVVVGIDGGGGGGGSGGGSGGCEEENEVDRGGEEPRRQQHLRCNIGPRRQRGLCTHSVFTLKLF